MPTRSRPLHTVTAGLLLMATTACSTQGDERSTSPSPSGPSATSGTAPSTSRSGESMSAATQNLFTAAAGGDLTAARAALSAGADLEARNDDGRTPVVVATKAGHSAVAVALLDAGADPNAKDHMQDSAFLYAGAEGMDEILRATLRHGADVRSTNRYGGTALIPASEHGHVSTARTLIAAGVPVDHVNNLGWTALLEAIVLGDGSADQVNVVRQLLAAGADPSIGDRSGRTPRHLAVDAGYTDIVKAIDDAG